MFKSMVYQKFMGTVYQRFVDTVRISEVSRHSISEVNEQSIPNVQEQSVPEIHEQSAAWAWRMDIQHGHWAWHAGTQACSRDMNMSHGLEHAWKRTCTFSMRMELPRLQMEPITGATDSEDAGVRPKTPYQQHNSWNRKGRRQSRDYKTETNGFKTESRVVFLGKFTVCCWNTYLC